MECVTCGSELVMEPGFQEARCPKCGMRYPLDVLREMNGAHTQDIQLDLSLAPNTRSSSSQATTANKSIASNNDLPKAHISRPSEAYPALDSWKTSYKLSILGSVLAAFICALPSGGIAGWIITITYAVATIIYALAIYPSLFTPKPRLSSSFAISFCNCLFGGFIFGSLWNHNLTSRKKGISYLVDMGLMTLGVIMLVALLLISGPTALDEQKMPEQEIDYTENVENPLNRITVPSPQDNFSKYKPSDPTEWLSKTYDNPNAAFAAGLQCLIDMGLSESDATAVMNRMANAEPEVNTRDYRELRRKNRLERGGGYIFQCPAVNTASAETIETRTAEFNCSYRRYSMVFTSTRVTEFDPNDLSQIVNESTTYKFTIHQMS